MSPKYENILFTYIFSHITFLMSHVTFSNTHMNDLFACHIVS